MKIGASYIVGVWMRVSKHQDEKEKGVRAQREKIGTGTSAVLFNSPDKSGNAIPVTSLVYLRQYHMEPLEKDAFEVLIGGVQNFRSDQMRCMSVSSNVID